MRRFWLLAANALFGGALLFAQAVGSQNTGASAGGNRTPGTEATDPKSGTPNEPAGKPKKVKLDPKIVKKARATPGHGKNAVPTNEPVTDPHESDTK
jgi:hypothetical protein